MNGVSKMLSLLLLASIACGSPAGDEGGDNLSPIAPLTGDPIAGVDAASVPSGVILALRQVAGPREIEVLDAASLGDEAFVLARIGSGAEYTLAWLTEDGDGWRIGDVIGPGLWTEAPSPGSNEAVLVPLETPDVAAVGGLADPTLTRHEIIRSSGHLVDASEPDGPGVVLIAEPWGQVRGFRGQNLVAASGVTSRSFPMIREVADDGLNAARDFLQSLRSDSTARARRLLISGIPEDEFLGPLENLVRSEVAEVGESRANGAVATFDILTSSGEEGTLSFYMALDGGTWRVWQYAFALAPSNG